MKFFLFFRKLQKIINISDQTLFFFFNYILEKKIMKSTIPKIIYHL